MNIHTYIVKCFLFTNLCLHFGGFRCRASCYHWFRQLIITFVSHSTISQPSSSPQQEQTLKIVNLYLLFKFALVKCALYYIHVF